MIEWIVHEYFSIALKNFRWDVAKACGFIEIKASYTSTTVILTAHKDLAMSGNSSMTDKSERLWKTEWK